MYLEGYYDTGIYDAQVAIVGASSPVEATNSNLITMARDLVNNAISGVTVSTTVESDNPEIASNGAITYGTSTVTGNVTFYISDSTATGTQTISVSVPQEAVYIAQGAIASSAPMSPTEGTDANIVTLAQSIVNNSISGVTVSSTVESNNSKIASDGTITYSGSTVTGSVTFTLYDNEMTATETVPVVVSEDTNQSNVQATLAALAAASPFSPTEGVDTNVIAIAQNIANNYGTTVSSTVQSNNSQVGPDGTITYGTSTVTGNVTFTVFSGATSGTQAVSVVVKKYTKTWVSVGPGISGSTYFESLAINASGTPYLAYTDNDNYTHGTVEEYTGGNWTQVGSLLSEGDSWDSLAISLLALFMLPTVMAVTMIRHGRGIYRR